MQLQDHIQSSALFLPDNPETVWLFTDTNEISTLYTIVDSALRQRPEFRLVIAVPRNELPELRRRFPHEQFVALPSEPGRIRPGRFSRSTLQILGAKYCQLAGTLSHSLKVEGDFDIHTILRLLPEATFAGADPGSSAPASYLIKLLAGSAIVQLNDLRLRLGTPHHILCLGNGPSSEDTRLQGCSFDCLFRVNWIWRDRGLYLNPNMVFTADTDLPFGSPRPIIALPNPISGTSNHSPPLPALATASKGLPICRRNSFNTQRSKRPCHSQQWRNHGCCGCCTAARAHNHRGHRSLLP